MTEYKANGNYNGVSEQVRTRSSLRINKISDQDLF